jgi:hypothetical protein
MRLFDSGIYIPLMHLLTFAFVALGMSAFYSFTRRFLPMFTTGILCLLVTVFPPFFVQTGDIYLEAPLFAGIALTLNALISGKVRQSMLWSAAAFFTKQNGAIAGLVVGAASLFDKEKSKKERIFGFFLRMSVVGVLAVIIVWLHSLSPVSQQNMIPRLFDGDRLTRLTLQLYSDGYQRYLANTPDLLLVFVSSLVSSLVIVFVAAFHKGQDSVVPVPVVYSAILILTYSLFMFVLLPVLWNYAQILIRYYMVVFPFCLVVLTYAVRRKVSLRVLHGLMFLAVALCVANRNGRLYPSFITTHGNDFSIAERSLEYRGLLEVQRRNIEKIQELAEKRQVLVGFFEQRYLRYPGNGYVTQLTPNAIDIGKYIKDHGGEKFNIGAISECIYLNMLYPWDETKFSQRIVNTAAETPGFEVKEEWQYESGVFRAQIFSLAPPGKSCRS